MNSSSEQNPSVGTTQHTTSSEKSQVPFSDKKWCPKHNGWKSRSGFYANQTTRDGLDPWCINCRRTYARDWYRDNIEQARGYRRLSGKDAEYKARHRALHRDRHYARTRLQRAREKGLVLNYCSWPGCTETEKIEGHHSDYSKPHEIVSLCRLHHKAADLLSDKLGFDLPTIDISIYFKKSKRVKPKAAVPQRESVTV